MAFSVLLPPAKVRGMISLNKSEFSKEVRIPVLKFKGFINCFITNLKPFLLKLENFKSVICDKSNVNEKIIYLNPNLISSFNSFGDQVEEILKTSGVSEDNLSFHDIILTFDNWKAHEIISAILPSSLSFTGFSTIGTIIHVNLKNELLPYKFVIAEVLLEKIKSCKSVVNKIKNINSTFRNFEMEILAGSDDLKTEVKENGCKFELNFRDVYWNPRLHEEHYKIICKLNQGDVLYDVFCGIGPFAIPAAKYGCEVLANDLNPACCEWLQRNMVINKINSGLTIFNKSGDVFIKEDVREDLLKRVADIKNNDARFHITMNLPSTAFTFLPVFVGLFEENELTMFQEHQLPIVHLYSFMKDKNNLEEESKKLIECTLNVRDVCYLEIHNVRNVAPNSQMVRTSFILNRDILRKIKTSHKRLSEETAHVDVKKLKLNEPELSCKNNNQPT